MADKKEKKPFASKKIEEKKEEKEEKQGKTVDLSDSGKGGNEVLDDAPGESGGGILPREIGVEMEKSYLEYAMSVIVARALPDVRDGLKPVHRRIIFAAHGKGWRSSHAFVKSAKIVGEVIGNFHPHGDTAIYESMVRLAQDWSLRYPLVDGQGNFGSVDGDSAAAMRYTEARLTKLTDELLRDIEKDTVDWRDTFDASRKEPTVLPTKVPNLLINGVTGIAVGMATNIPPHNLGEVLDGCLHVLDNPECEVKDLFEFVKGPDFPTASEIHGIRGVHEAYLTGRGKVVQRAVAEIIELKGGRHDIIVTEIPYMVNKATLVEKVADLVISKRVEGIRNIRDESSREGMRVVIELKRDAYPQKILNQLFKFTDLQKAFHCNMIALVDDGLQPKLLNLKEMIEHFIEHRKVVTVRRVKWELAQAEARAHILEGLKIALDNIDAVIETIKKSKTKEEAGENLMKKFKLSKLQAGAILEIRLSTLAAMETQKILDELAEKMKLVIELKAILADPEKVKEIVREEFEEIKDKFGDKRRTKIFQGELGEMTAEDTIANEPMIVTISQENYIKRMPPTTFRAQGRGGKGIKGAATKDEDQIVKVIVTNTHDWVYFFTDRGRVFRQRVFDIPQASRIAKGTAIVNLLNLAPDEKVTATFRREKNLGDKGFFFMATENGVVKKTAVSNFVNIRQSGLIALKIREGDRLGWVRWTSGDDNIFLVSRKGQSVRFKEGDVRSMGRTAAGVRGIRLKGDDKVVECAALKAEEVESAFLLTISENGYGKCTVVRDYRVQNRGGSGIKTANVTEKTGEIVGARILVNKEGDLLMISAKGTVIRSEVTCVPDLGRSTQGVRMMRLNKGDKVASMTVVEGAEEEPKEEGKGV